MKEAASTGTGTDDEASTDTIDAFVMQERRRTSSLTVAKLDHPAQMVPVIKTLNPRASMILPSAQRSPRTAPTSVNSPPVSPRTRASSSAPMALPTQHTTRKNSTSATTNSKGVTPLVIPALNTSAAVAIAIKSDEEDTLQSSLSPRNQQDEPIDEELRAFMQKEEDEYNGLLIKKHFITETMRAKNYGRKKMVSQDVSFFEQPTGSGTISDFCVTEHSTPLGTPPPERIMSDGVSAKQIALLKGELQKTRTDIEYIRKQVQENNNYMLILKSERDADKQSRSSFCFCW